MGAATSGFVTSLDASIHYLDCRPDDDRPDLAPVLFVPGMTDVADDYRAIADLVGRRTIVVDLRGHGRSSASDGWGLEHHVADIAAVVDATIDGPVHLMTFSRGTCYALGWLRLHAERVLSLAVGDYPAREIRIEPDIADRLLSSTWRGTPVHERVDPEAIRQVFAHSRDRELWDVVDALEVPVAVVRSSATAPLDDGDWERYAQLAPEVRREHYDDSPHDIFRVDRGRFPRLVAEVAADGDRSAPRDSW